MSLFAGQEEPPDMVDTIKGALDAATNLVQINDVQSQFRPEVVRLQKSDSQHDRTMAIQIVNLLNYRRKGIIEGWG